MTKWAYILIGDNNTGKTSMQKEMIYLLNSDWYERLDCNLSFPVLPRIGNRNVQEVFFASRSYQEKGYGSIPIYFKEHFNEKDAVILSSHLVITDIEDMVKELRGRFYNVCGVFFENSIAVNPDVNQQISESIPWDEKLYIQNPLNCDDQNKRIRAGSVELCWHLLSK
jgi:hypothetical protein